jgi:hypothetical protein
VGDPQQHPELRGEWQGCPVDGVLRFHHRTIERRHVLSLKNFLLENFSFERNVVRTWPWTLFRICCTVSAVLIFNQAVFAGQFLGGSFGALHTHRENATVAGIAILVTAGSGLLLRLRGGPAWPALASLGLFGLTAAQIALGFARLLTVHIPLGVAIIVLTILLTRWSWRSPAPAARPGERAERVTTAGEAAVAVGGTGNQTARERPAGNRGAVRR